MNETRKKELYELRPASYETDIQQNLKLFGLTGRQQMIAVSVMEGLPNREIEKGSTLMNSRSRLTCEISSDSSTFTAGPP